MSSELHLKHRIAEMDDATGLRKECLERATYLDAMDQLSTIETQSMLTLYAAADSIANLTTELAASRAREAKLQEALREIELHTWGYPDRLEPMRVEMRHVARAALSASEDAARQ